MSADLPILNLPTLSYRCRLSPQTGVEEIFDPQRKRYVRLTPEEWVRQHFVAYLIQELGYPQGRIGNEIPIIVGKTSKRCDTVIFNQEGTPIVVVEYKAPHVPLTQKVFNQIMRYNMTLRVNYVIVSNGLHHYCCRLNPQDLTYQFLTAIPDYNSL